MGRRGPGEGSIYKRADGRWAAQLDLGIRHGRRVRKTIYGRSHRDVRDKLAKTRRAFEASGVVADERRTVATFLGEWLESVRPRVRESTWTRYEGYVRIHIVPSLGHVRLARLTHQQLQRLYAERLAAGSSPTTVLHVHRMLHAALRQAVRWGLVVRNVTELVDPPKQRRHEIAALTADEVRRLLEAAKEDRLEALYVLAVTTGMRQGELLGLRWRDVDLPRGAIQIRGSLQRLSGGGFRIAEPKTASSRRQVLLTSIAVDALVRHRARQAEERLALGPYWDDSDLVFANEIGKPINVSNLLQRSFRPLLQRAGLPRIRFHDLRHTAATLLLEQGVHPKIVADVLGHSDIALTLRTYSHVTPTMQQHAADALERVLHHHSAASDSKEQ